MMSRFKLAGCFLPIAAMFALSPLALGDAGHSKLRYSEQGPKVKGRLHATGQELEFETETVFRPICGSDTSKLTLEDVKNTAQRMKALDAAHPPRLPAVNNVAGAPPPQFDFVFNVTTALPAGAAEALAQVEHYIEGQFSDPITVVVNFGFIPLSPGVLGQTSTNYSNVTYPNTRTGLIGGMDPDDTIQLHLPATATLPVRYDGNLPTITNETRVFVTFANFNATIGSTSTNTGTINFNSNFAWDYTPPSISGGAFCFRSVITHEVGHALGFISGADFRSFDMEMLDVYRFQLSDGTGDYNPDDLAEFATTPRLVTQNSPGTDDDVNSDLITVEFRMSDGNPNQASHFRSFNPGIYIMDPSLAPGETFHPTYFRTGDSSMFDAIGYSYPLINDSCSEVRETACNTTRYLDNSNVPVFPELPFSCGNGNSHLGALWYSFVADATSARISTCGSIASDTTFAVYDGACGSLTEIACSEDVSGCGTNNKHGNLCVQNLTIGNTYYIQVASNNFGTKGLIELKIQCSCDGACCLPAPGTCAQTTESLCENSYGGTYVGPTVTCLGDQNGDVTDDRCQSPNLLRSQIITADQEDLASNYDWSDTAPSPSVIDDFEGDGRPVQAIRWWGSTLDGNVPPDGWVVSFHEPKSVGSPNATALGVYYCASNVVAAQNLPDPGCDTHSVIQYHAELFECCLLQVNIDSRSGLAPAEGAMFKTDSCVPYELGIQAITGVRYDSGSCDEVLTAGAAPADFWGWHSTTNEIGARPALVGPLAIAGSDWTYGPWASASNACGAPNMSFELITSAAPNTASEIIANNGTPDNQFFLVSQHQGQLTNALTADDIELLNPETINDITWFMEENTSFTWNGKVKLEIYPDDGTMNPDESGGATAAMLIPDDGAAVTRTPLGVGFFTTRRASYAISGLNIPLSAGRWWISLSSGDNTSPGLCYWLSSHRQGVSPVFFGGEAQRRSPGEGLPEFAPWSQFTGGFKYDTAFYVTTTNLLDCNCNGISDELDLQPGGPSLDCNSNLIPDECETDCNSNDIPDDCDITSLLSEDCQLNGVPDECDIFLGVSLDSNNNGVPDECCFVLNPPQPPLGSLAKNRYLSVDGGNPGRNTALRVKLISLQHPDPPNLAQFPPLDYSAFEGQVRWIGPPAQFPETESPPTTFTAATLQCMPYFTDWSIVGSVQVYAAEILPSSIYHVQSLDDSCTDDIDDETSYSLPLIVTTARWGDVAPPYQSPSPASLSQPNISDVAAIVDKFKGVVGAAPKANVQIQPNVPNPTSPVNIADVAGAVDGFKLQRYPYPGPQNCP